MSTQRTSSPCVLRQMLAQRLHAIRFSGVVASGDKGHAGFSGDMRARPPDAFASQGRRRPPQRGVGQHASAPPVNGSHLADQLVRRTQASGARLTSAAWSANQANPHRNWASSPPPQQILLAATAQRVMPSTRRQRAFVPSNQVGVQRQVIGTRLMSCASNCARRIFSCPARAGLRFSRSNCGATRIGVGFCRVIAASISAALAVTPPVTMRRMSARPSTAGHFLGSNP